MGLKEVRDRLQQEVDKKRPEHEAEYLLDKAEKVLDEILPGGVELIMLGKNLPIEDLGGAIMGMIMMGASDNRKIADFISVAMELTCQAVISRKSEDE